MSPGTSKVKPFNLKTMVGNKDSVVPTKPYPVYLEHQMLSHQTAFNCVQKRQTQKLDWTSSISTWVSEWQGRAGMAALQARQGYIVGPRLQKCFKKNSNKDYVCMYVFSMCVYYVCMCVHVYVHALMSVHMWGHTWTTGCSFMGVHQKTSCRSWFSSTTWILGNKLKSFGSVAYACAHRATDSNKVIINTTS